MSQSRALAFPAQAPSHKQRSEGSQRRGGNAAAAGIEQHAHRGAARKNVRVLIAGLTRKQHRAQPFTARVQARNYSVRVHCCNSSLSLFNSSRSRPVARPPDIFENASPPKMM